MVPEWVLGFLTGKSGRPEGKQSVYIYSRRVSASSWSPNSGGAEVALAHHLLTPQRLQSNNLTYYFLCTGTTTSKTNIATGNPVITSHSPSTQSVVLQPSAATAGSVPNALAPTPPHLGPDLGPGHWDRGLGRVQCQEQNKLHFCVGRQRDGCK